MLRFFYLIWITAHYRLDLLLPRHPARRLLIPFIFINPFAWFAPCQSRGKRLRLALQKMGPIYTKFGQILSTRRDLIPLDIADELAKLQDAVPPFSHEAAMAILKSSYEMPLNTLFKAIADKPIASASIAQVYTAQLITGEDIILKIVRPTIKIIIDKDIKLLYRAATLLHRFYKNAPLLRPVEVVDEFAATIYNELDMMREANNAETIRLNFLNSSIIHVPKPYLALTRTNVLVMERVYGVRISEIETLKQHNVDLKKLAHDGVEIFMTQVFRDRFFHADMHPGNVLVDIRDPKNPRYCAIDFGIVGTLNEEDQYYLSENLLAFFKRDYRRIAVCHIESGWVPADTDINAFTAKLTEVLDPLFQKPMAEISFGQLLINLFNVAQQFSMSIQPQLLLLQKTLLNIEGLGRQLYPELNLWDTVYPFLKQWGQERKLLAYLRPIKSLFPYLPALLDFIAELIEKLIQRLHHG